MRVSFRAFAVVLLVACSPTIPTLPSQGGAPWFEVESEHVTLWTDASVERGRELVRELELRREVILSAMNTSSRASVFVIALRNARELAAYRPVEIIATAWEADNPTGQSGIVLLANDADRDHVVSHEMAHVVTGSFLAHQPPWLAEGIATYFEMVDFHFEEPSVQIGVPRGDRSEYLRRKLELTVPQLFACIEERCRDGAFYAASWATFSLLLNEHYDRLARYLQRLDHLPPDESAGAWYASRPELPPEERARERQRRREQYRREQAVIWRDAFPDLSPDALERELAEWLRVGKLRLPKIDIAIRSFATAVRPLRDADVLAARGWLGWLFTSDTAATRATVEHALALDRTNLLARLVDAKLTHTIALDDARATVAAHPNDWRALRLLELALHGVPEGAAVRELLCERSANTAPECAQRPPAAAQR